MHGIASSLLFVVYESIIRSWHDAAAVHELKTRLMRVLASANASFDLASPWTVVFAKPHAGDVPEWLKPFLKEEYVAPQQPDSNNCGAYVCAVAECIMQSMGTRQICSYNFDRFRMHMLWMFWFVAERGQIMLELSPAIYGGGPDIL